MQHSFSAKKSAGFTLIEMMIVVVIVGLLAAVALPSYRDSIRKSKRATAKTALLDIASREEKYFSLNNQYTDLTTLGVNATLTDSSGNTIYTLSLTQDNTKNPPIFTATATAKNDQANDSCGNFTVNNFGQQTPTTTGCW